MFIYTRLYRSNLYTIDTYGMLKRICDKHYDWISGIRFFKLSSKELKLSWQTWKFELLGNHDIIADVAVTALAFTQDGPRGASLPKIRNQVFYVKIDSGWRNIHWLVTVLPQILTYYHCACGVFRGFSIDCNTSHTYSMWLL